MHTRKYIELFREFINLRTFSKFRRDAFTLAEKTNMETKYDHNDNRLFIAILVTDEKHFAAEFTNFFPSKGS